MLATKNVSSRRSTPKIRIAMATTASTISGSAMAQFISAPLPANLTAGVERRGVVLHHRRHRGIPEAA